MASNAVDFGGRRARTFKYGTNVIIAAVAFFVVLLALNFFAQKSHKRIDLTHDKQYTISDSTIKLLGDLKDVVTVTVYATEEGTPANWTEQREELRNLLYEYRLKSKGNVRYNFKDPTKEDVAKEAQAAGMREVPMQQASTSEFTLKAGYLGFVVEYRGNSEKIPTLSPQSSVEYQLSRAINKVAQVNIPTIGVLAPQGNPFMGEQGNYTFLPEVLRQEGYTVKNLEAANLRELNNDIKLLMVLQPEDLSEEALFQIDQYVMNGGKLFVAAPGVNIDMRTQRATPKAPNINSLLENYGVRINEDLVEDWGRGLQQQFFTGREFVVSRNPFLQLTSDLSPTSPITKDLKQMIYIFPSSVSPSAGGTTASLNILAQTSEQAKKQEQFFILQQQQLKKPTPDQLTTHTLMAEVSGPLNSRFASVTPPPVTKDDGTTAVPTDVKKVSSDEARVIVTGTHMPFIDDIMSRPDAQINAIFLLNLADAMTRGGTMIALRSKHTEMAPLKANLDQSDVVWAQILAVGAVPVALVVLAFIMMFYNRRKRARYRAIYGAAGRTAAA